MYIFLNIAHKTLASTLRTLEIGRTVDIKYQMFSVNLHLAYYTENSNMHGTFVVKHRTVDVIVKTLYKKRTYLNIMHESHNS